MNNTDTFSINNQNKTKTLGFRFFDIYTKVLIPLGASYLSLCSIIFILSAFFIDESNIYIAIFFSICSVLWWIMYICFKKGKKSAFTLFFCIVGFGSATGFSMFFYVLFSVDPISNLPTVIPMFLLSIPCIFIIVYMFKRRKIFTLGTKAHEQYKRYRIQQGKKLIQKYSICEYDDKLEQNTTPLKTQDGNHTNIVNTHTPEIVTTQEKQNVIQQIKDIDNDILNLKTSLEQARKDLENTSVTDIDRLYSNGELSLSEAKEKINAIGTLHSIVDNYPDIIKNAENRRNNLITEFKRKIGEQSTLFDFIESDTTELANGNDKLSEEAKEEVEDEIKFVTFNLLSPIKGHIKEPMEVNDNNKELVYKWLDSKTNSVYCFEVYKDGKANYYYTTKEIFDDLKHHY